MQAGGGQTLRRKEGRQDRRVPWDKLTGGPVLWTVSLCPRQQSIPGDDGNGIIFTFHRLQCIDGLRQQAVFGGIQRLYGAAECMCGQHRDAALQICHRCIRPLNGRTVAVVG